MQIDINYIYYYTACFALILSGVFCAVVRWGHMCRPYDAQSGYFYPARKQATFFYSALILLFPYLIHPCSPDTWLYVRIFGILYYPVCYAMLLRSYFSDDDSKDKKLRHNGRIAILPFAVLLLLCGFAFVGGAELSTYSSILLWGCGALSVITTTVMCHIVRKLQIRIREYSENTYSNEEDFPYKFATIVLPLPLFWVAVMWVLMLSDSRNVKMWTDIVLTVWHVFFLLIILHPQKQDRVILQERNTDEESAPLIADSGKEGINEKPIEEDSFKENPKENVNDINKTEQLYIDRLNDLFEIKRVYLNPNLTILDVAKGIGRSRSQTSLMMNRIHGSFVVYVNRLRIEHANRLLKENPEMKQSDLYLSCGFNNRNSYTKWLKYFAE